MCTCADDSCSLGGPTRERKDLFSYITLCVSPKTMSLTFYFNMSSIVKSWPLSPKTKTHIITRLFLVQLGFIKLCHLKCFSHCGMQLCPLHTVSNCRTRAVLWLCTVIVKVEQRNTGNKFQQQRGKNRFTGEMGYKKKEINTNHSIKINQGCCG